MVASTTHPKAILDRLQAALKAEHGAIVRLLHHAYRSGGLGVASALESIARHEMRQFKWLAEQIVAAGGRPDVVARPESPEEGDDPVAWLRSDVAHAEEAMARYAELADAAAALVNPNEARALRSLALRMAQDEADQRDKLQALLAKVEAHGADALPEVKGEAHDPQTAAMLDAAITHEYEVILQYLEHAFIVEDAQVGRSLEDVAIEEMRHLGWLTEARMGRAGGGCPFWQAKRLALGDDALSMLEADEAREMEVVGDYAKAAAATEDAEAKALFTTLHGHELFHGQILGDLVHKLRAAKASEAPAVPFSAPPALSETPTETKPIPRPTVGTLLGQAQP